MAEIVLELKNLSKSFAKNKVLNGINLTIKKGSVLGLMGENGAGKSTLLKIMAKIEEPQNLGNTSAGKPGHVLSFSSPPSTPMMRKTERVVSK